MYQNRAERLKPENQLCIFWLKHKMQFYRQQQTLPRCSCNSLLTPLGLCNAHSSAFLPWEHVDEHPSLSCPSLPTQRTGLWLHTGSRSLCYLPGASYPCSRWIGMGVCVASPARWKDCSRWKVKPPSWWSIWEAGGAEWGRDKVGNASDRNAWIRHTSFALCTGLRQAWQEICTNLRKAIDYKTVSHRHFSGQQSW